MQKVRLGRTGLEVTKWALGGIPLSTVMGGNSEEAISQVIHAALDYGINFIDTSRMYMDSETLIGSVMKARRKECFLASKSISRSDGDVREDLEESLKQLQTDHIEIYQIHALKPEEVSTVMGKGGALEALKKARDEGLIDYIGLTSHHVDVMLDLVKTGEFDTVMFPFNVIEREPEKGLIPLARSMDVGTLVMKPLGGGAIRNIKEAFRFFNGFPVDVILNGVSNLDELKENLKCVEDRSELSHVELAEFEQEIEYLGKNFCRRCNYCAPCTNDIRIPDMIHHIWQMVHGKKYEDLLDEKKKLGETLLIWWQACSECGQCEEKCPYDLPTMQRRQELVDLFSR